jgi:hypothetical protein
MDYNNHQGWWDRISYFVQEPRFSENHVQILRFSSSSLDYPPASLMTSNRPGYVGNHQEPAFPFPGGPSAQDQQQQQIFTIYNPGVIFQQGDPNSRILELQAEYTKYKSDMKEVFQGIIKGCLGQAGQSLLGASGWLSGHIKELGKH